MKTRLEIGRGLILDELFDLSLYRELRSVGGPGSTRMLDELIEVELTHFAFWQEFFKLPVDRLDWKRRFKLRLIHSICSILGESAVDMVLEAIEVYGVRKYLSLWKVYKDEPMGAALRGVLRDEFEHEDILVTRLQGRIISPDRIRNVFLGFNDGIVEILGAVSGFFASFGQTNLVLIAGLTTAVAGSLSMAAGAFVAVSSENEVRKTQEEKAQFLGERRPGATRRIRTDFGRNCGGQLFRRGGAAAAAGAPRRTYATLLHSDGRDHGLAGLGSARVPLGHGDAQAGPHQSCPHPDCGRCELHDRHRRRLAPRGPALTF